MCLIDPNQSPWNQWRKISTRFQIRCTSWGSCSSSPSCSSSKIHSCWRLLPHWLRSHPIPTFDEAIAAARTVFEKASQLGMPKMHILNIGGGFSAGPRFTEAASAVKIALQKYFPNEPGLTVMAEPGRFFAESSFTIATSIFGKRVRNELREYWINDGIFGSMNLFCCTSTTM